MIRRSVLLIALPVIVIGAFILASRRGGLISDAWEDFVGPFLLTSWIGLGFTNAWDVMKESMHGASPIVVGATGVLGALVILAMQGGPRC